MSRSNNTGVLGLGLGLLIALAVITSIPIFRLVIAHIFGFYGIPPLGLGFTEIAVISAIIFPMLLMWLMLSIWVYKDAERNKMSGILWALLVFFGNIIGLIIYLIVRSSASTATPLAAASAPVCPHCKGAIQADFSVCPHCGATLKSTCPSCQKPVQSGWRHCPYCGASL